MDVSRPVVPTPAPEIRQECSRMAVSGPGVVPALVDQLRMFKSNAPPMRLPMGSPTTDGPWPDNFVCLGGFMSKVVSVRNFKGSANPHQPVRLIRDPKSPDPSAIRVVNMGGQMVGYVSNDIAEVLAGLMNDRMIHIAGILQPGFTSISFPLNIFVYGLPEHRSRIGDHFNSWADRISLRQQQQQADMLRRLPSSDNTGNRDDIQFVGEIRNPYSIMSPFMPRSMMRLPPVGRSTQGDDDKLYCICQLPYDESRFMVACDGPCQQWYHVECIGVREEDVVNLDRYDCPKCTQEKDGKQTERTSHEHNNSNSNSNISNSNNSNSNNSNSNISNSSSNISNSSNSSNSSNNSNSNKSNKSNNNNSNNNNSKSSSSSNSNNNNNKSSSSNNNNSSNNNSNNNNNISNSSSNNNSNNKNNCSNSNSNRTTKEKEKKQKSHHLNCSSDFVSDSETEDEPRRASTSPSIAAFQQFDINRKDTRDNNPKKKKKKQKKRKLVQLKRSSSCSLDHDDDDDEEEGEMKRKHVGVKISQSPRKKRKVVCDDESSSELEATSTPARVIIGPPRNSPPLIVPKSQSTSVSTAPATPGPVAVTAPTVNVEPTSVAREPLNSNNSLDTIDTAVADTAVSAVTVSTEPFDLLAALDPVDENDAVRVLQGMSASALRHSCLNLWKYKKTASDTIAALRVSYQTMDSAMQQQQNALNFFHQQEGLEGNAFKSLPTTTTPHQNVDSNDTTDKSDDLRILRCGWVSGPAYSSRQPVSVLLYKVQRMDSTSPPFLALPTESIPSLANIAQANVKNIQSKIVKWCAMHPLSKEVHCFGKTVLDRYRLLAQHQTRWAQPTRAQAATVVSTDGLVCLFARIHDGLALGRASEIVQQDLAWLKQDEACWLANAPIINRDV